ncbi:hypothetical protein TrCOL_g9469 [Triparma columacea]|uniref:Cystinosin n=1 Tax=Triparma columacea TaxID=722753 RepID=A0A9W7G035_9STRA|nr:hypothetical protein TrCOL_g9469 [Triparma columacea]
MSSPKAPSLLRNYSSISSWDSYANRIAKHSYLTLPIILVISYLFQLAYPSSDGDDDKTPLPSDYRPLHDWLGWVYFLSWSLSFYPQLLLNIHRGTTLGLSPDYALYNVVGFACYTTFTLSLFFSSSIITSYKNRHAGSSPLVSSQDVLFAIHAITLSVIGLMQVSYYDGIGMRGRQTPSRNCFVICCCIVSFATCYLILIAARGSMGKSVDPPPPYLSYLDYIYSLSYVKIFITLIKYIPQALSNAKRRSTEGWNVWNVILDFSGGVFSVSQLVGDCIAKDEWGGIKGDLPKLGLGVISMAFDVVFLVQHYLLYGGGGGGEGGGSREHSSISSKGSEGGGGEGNRRGVYKYQTLEGEADHI